MRLYLPLIFIGAAITVVTGSVYGHLSQRWGPAPNLAVAAEHMANFPTRIGEWQLLSENELSDLVIETLSCAAYVNRQYVDLNSGDTISVAIVVGPSGPISVHTPEICYSSRSYSVNDERHILTLLDAEHRQHSFWSLTFTPEKATADHLQVYYAWTDAGTWTAADFPRIQFAGRPVLYKLQLASLVPTMGNNEPHDSCERFLTDLLHADWSPINGTEG